MKTRSTSSTDVSWAPFSSLWCFPPLLPHICRCLLGHVWPNMCKSAFVVVFIVHYAAQVTVTVIWEQGPSVFNIVMPIKKATFFSMMNNEWAITCRLSPISPCLCFMVLISFAFYSFFSIDSVITTVLSYIPFTTAWLLVKLAKTNLTPGTKRQLWQPRVKASLGLDLKTNKLIEKGTTTKLDVKKLNHGFFMPSDTLLICANTGHFQL